VQEGDTYYTAASDSRAPEPAPLRQAKEHFAAAELLVEQTRNGPALELLSKALLATAAARGRQSRAPTVEQAGVWLSSEALPQGWLDQGQAALVMRGLSLAQAFELPVPSWHRCWRTVGVLFSPGDDGYNTAIGCRWSH
jgi:hypothetical protein